MQPEDGRTDGRRLSTASHFTEMQGDASGRKAEGSEYVSSRRAGERWPLSRVTDYRSLAVPQRFLWLAEMNHPSAFFCKPSITSDFSPQTPVPRPTVTRAYKHTLAADTAANLTLEEFC